MFIPIKALFPSLQIGAGVDDDDTETTAELELAVDVVELVETIDVEDMVVEVTVLAVALLLGDGDGDVVKVEDGTATLEETVWSILLRALLTDAKKDDISAGALIKSNASIMPEEYILIEPVEDEEELDDVGELDGLLDELEELDEVDVVDAVDCVDVGWVLVFVGLLLGSSGGRVGNGMSPPNTPAPPPPPPPPPPQNRMQVHPNPPGQIMSGTMWPFDSFVLEVTVLDSVLYCEYVVCWNTGVMVDDPDVTA